MGAGIGDVGVRSIVLLRLEVDVRKRSLRNFSDDSGDLGEVVR